MILGIIGLIISITVLVKSSDWFVLHGERIGNYFHLNPIVIGVTLFAFGTSLPELVTALISVSKGTTEIVAGNVIGSNIANILLVLGVAVLFSKRFHIKENPADNLMLIISTLSLIMAVSDGLFTIIEAIVSLVLFAIYLYRIKDEHLKKRKIELEAKRERLEFMTVLYFLISILLIYFSAEFTIDSVINIAMSLNIGVEVIAASAIAIGTSLPELMVSIAAVRKKKYELAVGNVVGSNIFNALLVMGIPGLFADLIIPGNMIVLGLPIMGGATLYYLLAMRDKKISRLESIPMIMLYIVFIVLLFL